jgi:hypothetical protein
MIGWERQFSLVDHMKPAGPLSAQYRPLALDKLAAQAIG